MSGKLSPIKKNYAVTQTMAIRLFMGQYLILVFLEIYLYVRIRCIPDITTPIANRTIH
jgi:hypothetical protein